MGQSVGGELLRQSIQQLWCRTMGDGRQPTDSVSHICTRLVTNLYSLVRGRRRGTDAHCGTGGQLLSPDSNGG